MYQVTTGNYKWQEGVPSTLDIYIYIYIYILLEESKFKCLLYMSICQFLI
ncbi:MAG: hypothetical protein N7Q72_05510 [Spiroplasma sp. Tabriz.8]|nr:hypothetical protein [Spiroplasma sp. Tabriz.8]